MASGAAFETFPGQRLNSTSIAKSDKHTASEAIAPFVGIFILFFIEPV